MLQILEECCKFATDMKEITMIKRQRGGEVLRTLYQKPENESEGKWLSLKAISKQLKQAFKGAYKEEAGTFEKIGNFLNRPEYKFRSRRRNSGSEYFVKELP